MFESPACSCTYLKWKSSLLSSCNLLPSGTYSCKAFNTDALCTYCLCWHNVCCRKSPWQPEDILQLQHPTIVTALAWIQWEQHQREGCTYYLPFISGRKNIWIKIFQESQHVTICRSSVQNIFICTYYRSMLCVWSCTSSGDPKGIEMWPGWAPAATAAGSACSSLWQHYQTELKEKKYTFIIL